MLRFLVDPANAITTAGLTFAVLGLYAVLSGHHIVLLGERGQGKTRIIRRLVELLDPVVPVVRGCEINDDPMRPVCAACRRRLASEGDLLEVDWLERDRRYGEKLATPDVTIADLVGEIDPVKIAEGRYLSDEEAIHFGIVPRTHRGIFAINELPDLTEKVQVGLFNLMEERDLQIKGFKVRLPLDVVVVATANPEDYTSRGRIVTPLKDRFDVQIRTHYPRTIEHEIGQARAVGQRRAALGARGPYGRDFDCSRLGAQERVDAGQPLHPACEHDLQHVVERALTDFHDEALAELFDLLDLAAAD